MDVKNAGSSLDSLVSSFNARIAELQELVIGRNNEWFHFKFPVFLLYSFYFPFLRIMHASFALAFFHFAVYPSSSITDLSAVDTTLKTLELQVQAIKDRLREETEAIPKAKKLINASLRQQKKLQNMSLHVPSLVPDRMLISNSETNRCLFSEFSGQEPGVESLKLDEEPAAVPKEKKGRGSPPLWHITGSELDSLSSYMRGRLTLEKVNAALNDMASYAEANAQLIAAPRKKLAENVLEKALELRAIATMEGIKGKHFFLEADIKGPNLKLDNIGKAILTVLRHLCRISETRIGHHRVIILQKPQ